jgi:N-acetylmuramoyl-L-alanine amidase
MSYDSIVISSGHGKYVRGASGILDEVDEARRVVERVADKLEARGIDVDVFHDNISTTQSENLASIVDYHNAQERDLDVSIHFNAYVETSKPMGVEALYVTQSALAGQVSLAIADAGDFINRGAKKRTDLYFLNETAMPSILIETCFVDSEADADLYAQHFDEICEAIAGALGGESVSDRPPVEEGTSIIGKVSQFGGPNDTGVAADEGLAFISEVDQMPYLFLPHQPAGTTGLARRLNPYVHYIACRWDYDQHPKETLLSKVAQVRAIRTGVTLAAIPADWGPHESTGRIADISPSLMADLGIATDDEVEVIFPFTEDVS